MVYDGNRLKKLVDNASENNDVKRVIADRKNSSHRSMDCYPRKVVAVLRQLKDLKKWKNSVSYGYRWIAETVFSSMKRMFGEYVTDIRFENMIKELILRASLYNWFQSIAIT